MITEPGRVITWGELHVGARQAFEEAGFTELTHPTPRRVVMRYDFSPELRPILTALGTWALRGPTLPKGPVSAVSAMLTLQTYGTWSDKVPAVVRVVLGERAYLAKLTNGRAEVVTDEASRRAEATVVTDPDTFVQDLTGLRPVAALTVTGDSATVKRMIAGIEMPRR
jgi:hypothetical protein